jgi:uncharacterized protein YndB with AHSA1/START domain
MKKQQFKTTIHAARNLVWHALWNGKNYNTWTSAFAEGSSAVTDWNEGSEILFLDGKGNGMYSVIDKKEEPGFMAFRHLGEVKGNEKLPPQTWAGAMETYTLTETGNGTELVVEMDVEESWLEYFMKTWPAALEKLKTLAESGDLKKITVETTINAPVEKVWDYWTGPQHIMQWNAASDDWFTPAATNDLRPGGKFVSTMAAKDGSFSFDFEGIYDEVRKHQFIAYTMTDGRKVQVNFSVKDITVTVQEIFDAETMHSLEMQRFGWQAILNNFKKYTESN